MMCGAQLVSPNGMIGAVFSSLAIDNLSGSLTADEVAFISNPVSGTNAVSAQWISCSDVNLTASCKMTVSSNPLFDASKPITKKLPACQQLAYVTPTRAAATQQKLGSKAQRKLFAAAGSTTIQVAVPTSTTTTSSTAAPSNLATPASTSSPSSASAPSSSASSFFTFGSRGRTHSNRYVDATPASKIFCCPETPESHLRVADSVLIASPAASIATFSPSSPSTSSAFFFGRRDGTASHHRYLEATPASKTFSSCVTPEARCSQPALLDRTPVSNRGCAAGQNDDDDDSCLCVTTSPSPSSPSSSPSSFIASSPSLAPSESSCGSCSLDCSDDADSSSCSEAASASSLSPCSSLLSSPVADVEFDSNPISSSTSTSTDTNGNSSSSVDSSLESLPESLLNGDDIFALSDSESPSPASPLMRVLVGSSCNNSNSSIFTIKTTRCFPDSPLLVSRSSFCFDTTPTRKELFPMSPLLAAAPIAAAGSHHLTASVDRRRRQLQQLFHQYGITCPLLAPMTYGSIHDERLPVAAATRELRPTTLQSNFAAAAAPVAAAAVDIDLEDVFLLAPLGAGHLPAEYEALMAAEMEDLERFDLVNWSLDDLIMAAVDRI